MSWIPDCIHTGIGTRLPAFFAALGISLLCLSVSSPLSRPRLACSCITIIGCLALYLSLSRKILLFLLYFYFGPMASINRGHRAHRNGIFSSSSLNFRISKVREITPSSPVEAFQYACFLSTAFSPHSVLSECYSASLINQPRVHFSYGHSTLLQLLLSPRLPLHSHL